MGPVICNWGGIGLKILPGETSHWLNPGSGPIALTTAWRFQEHNDPGYGLTRWCHESCCCAATTRPRKP
jgi:hypothetical protein